MKILDDLRRLFAPRTGPAAETATEPTADRPPPAPIVSFPTEPEPTTEDTIHADDVAEVRAALEAVAAPPAPPAEPDASVAPPPSDTAAAGPEPATIAAPAGALVLTLAAPAATFTVARTAATLGRGQENTIRLDDLSVSRRHARIAYRQGGYWISDLGSMGGTWVDGVRLSAPHRLADGQVIDIGLCHLTVRVADSGSNGDTKKSASRPRSEMAGQVRRRR
jgi:hypothetical protein